MQKRRSELEALFVESAEGDVDRVLRGALEGRVSFERATGRMLPRPGLFKLSQRKKIVVLLLARQALNRLEVAGARLEATAEELAGEGQMPAKSCGEQLSRLKASRLVQKGVHGYAIPSWNILAAAEYVASTRED